MSPPASQPAFPGIPALSGWTSAQRHVVAASFLGWTLDAFDFFLLVFVLKDIAAEFNTDISDVTFAILLTLAMRPIGAFLFGRAADRFGRRPTLMVNILLYSFLEFASGFAPSLTALLILRALYGVAMGGEWGVGASLTMESVPPHSRGFVSGLLQSGYPTGYFLASISTGCCSSTSAGAACSWLASSPRCSSSTSGAPCRSRPVGVNRPPSKAAAPGRS
jgi:SHS family lactate transporter-like MFS transporter